MDSSDGMWASWELSDSLFSPTERLTRAAQVALSDEKLFAQYWELSNGALPKMGLVEIPNALVFGNWGVALSLSSRLFVTSFQEIGWPHELVRFQLERLGWDFTRESVEIPDEFLGHFDVELESAVLLAFPGINTFGHWIIDVPGRLKALELLGGSDAETMLIGQEMPWQQELIKSLTNKNLDLFSIGNQIVRVNRLVVPTVLRRNDFITTPVYHGLLPIPKYDTANGAPLMLRHTPMTSINRREQPPHLSAIENHVEGLGGTIIDPLEVTTVRLRELMSSHGLIIGEDSSALHNIVFSDHNNSLVILTEKRINFLHAGLQSLRGGRVTYLSSNDHEGGTLLSKVKNLFSAASNATDRC